jgi:hypothetical protein
MSETLKRTLGVVVRDHLHCDPQCDLLDVRESRIIGKQGFCLKELLGKDEFYLRTDRCLRESKFSLLEKRIDELEERVVLQGLAIKNLIGDGK